MIYNSALRPSLLSSQSSACSLPLSRPRGTRSCRSHADSHIAQARCADPLTPISPSLHCQRSLRLVKGPRGRMTRAALGRFFPLTKRSEESSFIGQDGVIYLFDRPVKWAGKKLFCNTTGQKTGQNTDVLPWVQNLAHLRGERGNRGRHMQHRGVRVSASKRHGDRYRAGGSPRHGSFALTPRRPVTTMMSRNNSRWQT